MCLQYLSDLHLIFSQSRCAHKGTYGVSECELTCAIPFCLSSQDIEAKLERELIAGLDACQEEVMGFMRPVEALTQAQVR